MCVETEKNVRRQTFFSLTKIKRKQIKIWYDVSRLGARDPVQVIFTRGLQAENSQSTSSLADRQFHSVKQ